MERQSPQPQPSSLVAPYDEKNPSTKNKMTEITDLDMDSLVQCASYLSLQDISNMAMSCKLLQRVSYSDSIWLPLFREKWPEQMGRYSSGTRARENYMARHKAVMQFCFDDPLVTDLYTESRPFSHLLLGRNSIIFSQGSLIQVLKIDSFIEGRESVVSLRDHNARITCMRLFSTNEACFIRNEALQDDNVLISSSSDRTIRLWWKGSCFRCFKGHNGPVSTLSDKLLGDIGSKVLASGGEDGTVRLWSISSGGKRGQQALNATLHGHEKPIKLISVSGHKTSLLISVAADSKIRAWDSTVVSTSRSSCCVGMTSVPGAPFGIKCFESMLYLGSGCSVHAIDLRTMKKAFTAAGIGQQELYSFDMLPSRSIVCTGGNKRALLWDIRKTQDGTKPHPVAELEGHVGPVTHLHIDPYKIVTGGRDDFCTSVWDVLTGALMNSLTCCDSQLSNVNAGCNAVAVDGSRIVTTSCGEDGVLRFRDYMNASCPVSSVEDAFTSKFWNSLSYSSNSSDSDE